MMGEHECTSRLRGYNFFFTTTLLPEGRKIALINLGLDDSARRATRRCRVSSLCGLEPRIRPWRTTLYNKEDNAGGRHVVHNAEVVEFYQRAFFCLGIQGEQRTIIQLCAFDSLFYQGRMSRRKKPRWCCSMCTTHVAEKNCLVQQHVCHEIFFEKVRSRTPERHPTRGDASSENNISCACFQRREWGHGFEKQEHEEFWAAGV